ncbi:MAG: hypothetical protein ACRD0K_14255 [Egibacteraceae bacterium]
MSPRAHRWVLAIGGVLSLLLTLPWLLRLGTEPPPPTVPPTVAAGTLDLGLLEALGLAGPVDEYGEIIDRQLKQPGVIVYNPTERMRVGRAERVEMRIAREFSDEILEGLRISDQPRIEELPVGAAMRAELEGDSFAINLIGSDVQPLGSTRFREWRWNVTPTASGSQDLWLTVLALYEDQHRIIDLVVLQRKIQVAVNPVHAIGRWLGANWSELMGALGMTGASVMGFLYAKLRGARSGQPSEKPAPPAQGSQAERQPGVPPG